MRPRPWALDHAREEHAIRSPRVVAAGGRFPRLCIVAIAQSNVLLRLALLLPGKGPPPVACACAGEGHEKAPSREACSCVDRPHLRKRRPPPCASERVARRHPRRGSCMCHAHSAGPVATVPDDRARARERVATTCAGEELHPDHLVTLKRF